MARDLIVLSGGHPFEVEAFDGLLAGLKGWGIAHLAGWEHPPGGDLIAWVKPAGNAQLVCLQPGDGPQACANPNIRRLLANALGFTSRAHQNAPA